jgi:hypothetical protein
MLLLSENIPPVGRKMFVVFCLPRQNWDLSLIFTSSNLEEWHHHPLITGVCEAP